MLFSNTPLSYLFWLLYCTLTAAVIFFSDSLIILWVIIELQIIIYIVVSLPYFRFFHSSLLLYFLVQSVSSLIVLAFCFFSSYFLMLSFMLKLGIFPFYGWYLSSLPAFPILPLLLSLTVQNLPSFLLFSLFFSQFPSLYIVILILFSFLGTFSSLPSVFSLRLLVTWSSLITNIWFILALCQSSSCFLIYFLVYSFVLLLLLSYWGSSFEGNSSGLIIILLFSLGGFPPLPLFFVNIYVLYYVAIWISFPLLLLILLSSVIVIYIYCSVCLSKFLVVSSKL